MTDSYYFMSVGEKSYFYTLNYSYIEMKYRQNVYGNYIGEPVRRFQFIRNLSHDFNEAIEKAKQWHSEQADGIKLKLMSSPNAMSERELSERMKRIERVESGVFISGKYKNVNVADVPKSYVHWMICNMYSAERSDDEQHLSALICYHYADKQGWIAEWAKKGHAVLFPADYEQKVNEIITDDTMIMGKHEDEKLSDFLYTKKKTIRVHAAGYVKWLCADNSDLDRFIRESELTPVLCEEDGKKYYTIQGADFVNRFGRTVNRLELCAMMVRNYLSDHFEKEVLMNTFGRRNAYKYRIVWNDTGVSEMTLVQACPRYEVE